MLRCWRFLEVGVTLEGQVPMPYPFTGVRTLLAQPSPVPYSGRAWGPPWASKQCHLAHEGGMPWRRTGGASSVGRCHELECLGESIGKKGSLQCNIDISCALRSVAANGQGHIAEWLGQLQPKGVAGRILAGRRVHCEVKFDCCLPGTHSLVGAGQSWTPTWEEACDRVCSACWGTQTVAPALVH